MSAKATRLKTMKNELTKCTKKLQTKVKRRGLLYKSSLNTADLCALVGTVGLSTAAVRELDKVLICQE
jgi:hypothetical protein